MALELRQQLKLAQQLVMTPQLQQAIKLLQLSRLELLETVQQELVENPFLEESGGEEAGPETVAEDGREPVAEEVYDRELAKDADWEDYLGEFASTPRLSQSREYEAAEEISPLEARYAPKPTLAAPAFAVDRRTEGHWRGDHRQPFFIGLFAGQRGGSGGDGPRRARRGARRS